MLRPPQHDQVPKNVRKVELQPGLLALPPPVPLQAPLPHVTHIPRLSPQHKLKDAQSKLCAYFLTDPSPPPHPTQADYVSFVNQSATVTLPQLFFQSAIFKPLTWQKTVLPLASSYL